MLDQPFLEPLVPMRAWSSPRATGERYTLDCRQIDLAQLVGLANIVQC